MDILTTTTVATTTAKRIEIGFTQIRRLLEREGITIPAGASITVSVPGGGDWSNCDLAIDDQHPVVVAWVEVTTND